MAGVNANQPQLRESAAQQNPAGLGAKSLSPPRPANPIAQFRLMPTGHVQQADRADERAVSLARDGQRDLPAGGKRLVQRAEGYAATLVAGIPIFERGEHTGAKPGRLVRRGR